MAGEPAKCPPIDHPVFESKSSLFVENVTAQEALFYYECLVNSVRQSQQTIVDLGAYLEEQELQSTEDYDRLHADWGKCYAKKKEEVEKLKVDLAVSYGLLKGCQIRVADLKKKLFALEQTNKLPEEKETIIKDQRDQLAKWEGQARAILGGMFGGGTQRTALTINITSQR